MEHESIAGGRVSAAWYQVEHQEVASVPKLDVDMILQETS
jgi:hypothetical protein